ncbi:TPA: hypothetical protein RQO78_005418 [Klebsiella michiganensis]|nr:hypothetical protein [Klebsiella michiganensis]
MYERWVVWGSVCIVVIALLGTVQLPTSEDITFGKRLLQNIGVLSSLLSVVILIIVAIFLLDGMMNRKYSFKVERLNFGGLNILFDNSDALFIKSIQNFLDTKRTLFKINVQQDAFDEVFNSYYEVYQFVRVEMRVLNIKRKKDLELYMLANTMLKKLNAFLTEHQNNYRRWHKYVSDKDEVKIDEKPDGEAIVLRYHLTPIGKIQTYYYHFNKLVNDFTELNKFFQDSVASQFSIDMDKWSN